MRGRLSIERGPQHRRGPGRLTVVGVAALGVILAGCGGGSRPTPTSLARTSRTTGPTDSTTSAVPPTTDTSVTQPPPSGAMAYTPSSIAATCNDIGGDPTQGITDAVRCLPQAGVTVTYDLFDNGSDMQTAWNAWSAADPSFSSTLDPGDCNSSNEIGTWSIGGNQIGQIACPDTTSREVNIVWDDPNTNVLAIVYAPDYAPADIHTWWLGVASSING